MIKHHLLAPGPTPIPPQVEAALGAPIDHHRKTEFKALFQSVSKDLSWLFQTSQPVIALTGSGTAAMTAAVSNFFSRGDTVIVIQGGKFGERWGEISDAYGLNKKVIDVEWGHAVSVDAVSEALNTHPDARGVLVQASETSTGAAHPVEALAQITRDRSDTLLVVDGISAVGAMDLRTDEWGIDVMVSGAQKGFMIPPGLAFLTASEKAWKMAERSDLPSYYLDMQKEVKKTQAGTTAWTPAIGLFYGLEVALNMMKEEGLEHLFRRHMALSCASRAGAEAMGLSLFAPDSPSRALTSICVPETVDGVALVNHLRNTYGVTLAGGQNHLKGRIMRLAHLGYVNRFDTLTGLSAIGMGLNDLGHKTDVGAGINAAIETIGQFFDYSVKA